MKVGDEIWIIKTIIRRGSSYFQPNIQTHIIKRLISYVKKQQEDGIKENPNNTIWNLT